MTQQNLTKRRAGAPGGVAVALVGAAAAVLLGLLMSDGGAPVALCVIAGASAFVAVVGSWRMLS